MCKLGIAIFLAVAGAVITWRKRVTATKRLGELDRGERCIACNGTNMARRKGTASCLNCGHEYSIAAMASIQANHEALGLAKSD